MRRFQSRWLIGLLLSFWVPLSPAVYATENIETDFTKAVTANQRTYLAAKLQNKALAVAANDFRLAVDRAGNVFAFSQALSALTDKILLWLTELGEMSKAAKTAQSLYATLPERPSSYLIGVIEQYSNLSLLMKQLAEGAKTPFIAIGAAYTAGAVRLNIPANDFLTTTKKVLEKLNELAVRYGTTHQEIEKRLSLATPSEIPEAPGGQPHPETKKAPEQVREVPKPPQPSSRRPTKYRSGLK